jgi:hypothetical protein
MISDEFISATDNCAIFKGKISDDSVSCLVQNIKAENNNSSHWQNQRKLNHKPIQMTDEGTIFVYGSTFGLDQNYSNTLFKVKPDGVLQNVIGDDVTLYSFISLDSNSIVYQSSDGLKMLTDLDSDTVSTVDVSTNSTGIFTVDDHQTLIHQNNSSLNFTKASKIQIGTNEISGARTKSINNAPSNLIFADDGGIYGFESNNWGGDITLQRILPYSEDTFATCEMNGDAIQSFSDPIQISKGYAFCIGSENLTGVGDRNIINVVRMIDGIKITLLNDENWEQRYSISSWRLSNDVLYFSGFDKTTSTMISGELDVIGLKQSNEGDPESIYLSINQSASIVDENIVISDREFLVASVPENHTGGTPDIVEYYTHENNNSSISIEFNKWMNPQSVDENISLYSIDKYDFKYTIPTINVWLGRRLHMMMDNNVSLKVTAEMRNFDAFFAEYQVGSDYVVQDLLENTEYTIAMLSGAFDLDEIPIEPSVKSFTTGDNLDLGFQNIDPLDFDGDKIPNYLEDLLGLDIFDPADGSDDIDGDGYTNTEEAATGSDLNDENSVPDIIENGFTELFYNSGDFTLEGNLKLDLNSSKDSDGGSILFPYVYPYDAVNHLYFSAYFDDGVLSFYVGGATVWETFTIILDGDSLLDTPLTPSYTCDRIGFEVSGILWHKCQLEIARGYHEIKWQNQSAGFNLKLDNVEFNQN